jgi:hypothetical protein
MLRAHLTDLSFICFKSAYAYFRYQGDNSENKFDKNAF